MESAITKFRSSIDPCQQMRSQFIWSILRKAVILLPRVWDGLIARCKRPFLDDPSQAPICINIKPCLIRNPISVWERVVIFEILEWVRLPVQQIGIRRICPHRIRYISTKVICKDKVRELTMHDSLAWYQYSTVTKESPRSSLEDVC